MEGESFLIWERTLESGLLQAPFYGHSLSNAQLVLCHSISALKFQDVVMVVICTHFADGDGVGCHTLFRGSSQPKDPTRLSCTAGGFFTA